MQYTLICEETADKFEYKVSECLRVGWKLKGETFTARRTDVVKKSVRDYTDDNYVKQYDVFCQAMVKYDKGEKEE